MARYLFVYRSDESDMSPEEMQACIQRWMDWIGKAMQEGWMVAPGDALKPEGCVVQADRSVTDGPFAESKEMVGGYSIVEADSIEAACEYAKGCPGIDDGGSVEVRELAVVSAEQHG